MSRASMTLHEASFRSICKPARPLTGVLGFRVSCSGAEKAHRGFGFGSQVSGFVLRLRLRLARLANTVEGPHSHVYSLERCQTECCIPPVIF